MRLTPVPGTIELFLNLAQFYWSKRHDFFILLEPEIHTMRWGRLSRDERVTEETAEDDAG